MARYPLRPYIGRGVTIDAGQPYEWTTKFVKPTGIRKWRNVIHHITLKCVLNFASVTAQPIAARDKWRALAKFDWRDEDGPYFNSIAGDKLFAWAEGMMMPQPGAPIGADVAVSAGVTSATINYEIPVALPKLERPQDTAVGAEEFARESTTFAVQIANDSDFTIAGTADLTNVQVTPYVWCAEELSEHDAGRAVPFEQKKRFTVNTHALDAVTDFELQSLRGQFLFDSFLHKRGASGGTNLLAIDGASNANRIDSVLAEDLQLINAEAQQMVDRWRYDQGSTLFVGNFSGNDLRSQGKAFHLASSPHRCQLSELLPIAKNPRIRLNITGTIADMLVTNTGIEMVSGAGKAAAETLIEYRHRPDASGKAKTLTGKNAGDFGKALPQKFE